MTIVVGLVTTLALFAYVSFILYENCRYKIQVKENDKRFTEWYQGEQKRNVW